jgi:hypothetical protein
MKKFILSALMLIVTTISYPQTSVYHPFPVGDAYWRESSEGYQCCCSDYQYILRGDTTIGGYIYQNIEHSGVTFDLNPGGWCIVGGYSHYFKHYKGAIRNDIPGKKVWFVPADSSSEQLLYDFNMELHDTLAPSYLYNQNWAGPDYYICIGSIDSVLVGEYYHKRFGIVTTNDLQNVYAYLIEGVGSSFGLFGSLGVLWPPFEFGSLLECLTIDGVTVFPDNSTACLLITGINKPTERLGFSIYPNPMTETARIIMPQNVYKSSLIILNMSGMEILSFSGVSNNSFINLKNLPSGMFIYHFTSNGSITSSGKLIVN